MSFVFVRELEVIEKKTLIYFTNLLPIFTLNESYTYVVPENFCKFVFDLRHFSIQNFPIICYDDGDMLLASKAYCILKSMNYNALVLYGGLKASEEEGLALIPYRSESIPFIDSPIEIDSSKLHNTQICTFTVKNFPFSIYDVIGKNLTKEKLKKLIETNGIRINCENKVLAGPSASILALILVFFGESFPNVYLGEWFEARAPIRKLTKPETFQTPGTVYYDAEAEEEEKEKSFALNEEELKSENVIVTYYKIPSIEPNRASVKYAYEKNTINCKSCSLL